VRVWTRAVSDVVRHGIGARRDSWRKFTTTSAYVEYGSGGVWMDTLRYDLRHAIRSMGRQPVTSLIVVMTLALAIGANTAVFSAVHTVLIRPLRMTTRRARDGLGKARSRRRDEEFGSPPTTSTGRGPRRRLREWRR
jgi:hypothetical protein